MFDRSENTAAKQPSKKALILQFKTKVRHYLLLHPFNGLFSGTILVSRYQKGKTSLDLNEARDDGVLG